MKIPQKMSGMHLQMSEYYENWDVICEHQISATHGGQYQRCSTAADSRKLLVSFGKKVTYSFRD